jgi:hypothetical protein
MRQGRSEHAIVMIDALLSEWQRVAVSADYRANALPSIERETMIEAVRTLT